MAGYGREGGYIKLHRQIESWPLWKSMPVAQRMVWVQILLCANWKTDVMWFGAERVTVERGTLAHSEAEIARRAGVGRQVVRDALAKLMREGAVTREKSLPGNHAPWLLTIVNYERFQGNDETENPQPQHSGTNEEPTGNQRGTPREEGEEGKKETFSLALEPPNPPALADGKVRHLSPQQEAFAYWEANIWPRISGATCPEPGKGVFIRLAALCKRHGLDEVKAAMERAASMLATDAWVREHLTLQHFVADANFAKYLPRGQRQAAPTLRNLLVTDP